VRVFFFLSQIVNKISVPPTLVLIFFIYFRNLYGNMERARTCDSQAKGLPGMFASINNSTDENGEIIGCKVFNS
jgi:hypothetical protein